jgi:hypothetical protein
MPSKMCHHSSRKCLATVVAAVRTDMAVVEVVDMVEEEAVGAEEEVVDAVMETAEATVEVEAMVVVEEEEEEVVVVVDIAMDGKRYLVSMHPSGMTNDESYAPFETSASFWTTLFISRFGMRSTLQPLFVIDQNPITNTRTFTRYWMEVLSAILWRGSITKAFIGYKVLVDNCNAICILHRIYKDVTGIDK